MEKVAIIDAATYKEFNSNIHQLFKDIEYIRKNIQVAPKTLYTNKEMIELLGVNIKTLKKYRDEGYLGYSQIGDKFFYSQADLTQFLTMTHREAFA